MFIGAVALSAALVLPAVRALADRRGDAAAKAISEALSSSTEIEFIDAPLEDFVDFLKDYHKLEIQLDKRALDDVGIEPGHPVTCDLKGISLRSALRLILSQMDLTYTIQDEVLLITTPEEAETKLITEIYVVTDLLSSDGPAGHYPNDGKTLINLITSTVIPTSWDTVGGPGSVTGVSFSGVDMLFISQDFVAHEEIAALLDKIRETVRTNQEEPGEGAASKRDG
jgi:hypothetical protein